MSDKPLTDAEVAKIEYASTGPLGCVGDINIADWLPRLLADRKRLQNDIALLRRWLINSIPCLSLHIPQVFTDRINAVLDETEQKEPKVAQDKQS